MFVQIEVSRHGIVGHCEIKPPVVIHVHEDGSEPIVALGVRNSRFNADIRERSVAVVVVQVITLAWQPARPAHDLDSTELAEPGR